MTDIDPNNWGLKRPRLEENLFATDGKSNRHMDWRTETTKCTFLRVWGSHGYLDLSISRVHTRFLDSSLSSPARPSNFRRTVLASVEPHKFLGWYRVSLKETGRPDCKAKTKAGLRWGSLLPGKLHKKSGWLDSLYVCSKFYDQKAVLGKLWVE